MNVLCLLGTCVFSVDLNEPKEDLQVTLDSIQQCRFCLDESTVSKMLVSSKSSLPCSLVSACSYYDNGVPN